MIILTYQLKQRKIEADPSLRKYKKAGIGVVVYGHRHIAFQLLRSNNLISTGEAGKRRLKVIPPGGFLTLADS